MPITQADLDALDKAIAQGVRTYTSADRTVTYQSVGDMITARNHLAAQISNGAASPGRSRQTLLYHGGRGL